MKRTDDQFAILYAAMLKHILDIEAFVKMIEKVEAQAAQIAVLENEIKNLKKA